MRSVLLVLVGLVACSSADDQSAQEYCSALAASNEGCWEDALDATCLDLYGTCGSSMVVMESCPVQLGCG